MAATHFTEYNTFSLYPCAGKFPRYLLQATWTWVLATSILIFSSKPEYVPVVYTVLFIYGIAVMLFRPFQEAPFALLLVASGPNDNFIFLAALLFFIRALFSGKIYLPNNFIGYLYVFLIFVISSSVLLSYATVQFKPIQTVFWVITLLIPLTLSVVRYKHVIDGAALSKYAILLITLQILPVIAAVPEHLSTGSPDVFGGTWLDADILGFWGTALMMGAGLLLAIGKYHQSDKKKLLFIMVTGTILAVAASGKIYSVFIIAAGLFFFVISSQFVQGLLHGKAKPMVLLLAGGLGMFLAFSAVSKNMGAIRDWAEYQFEHSHKVIFLDRVFNQMDAYGYSNMLGVGPGMLGSRAANAVSADVLHKEQVRLPQAMQGAPAPEARIMAGLFDKEFQDRVRYMSANMVIPFSGIGSVKGELGYLGLVTLMFLFFFLFWPMAGLVRDNNIIIVSVVVTMATLTGLSTIFLAIFDTAWEQPKIMVFLSVLFMAVKVGNNLRSKLDEVQRGPNK